MDTTATVSKDLKESFVTMMFMNVIQIPAKMEDLAQMEMVPIHVLAKKDILDLTVRFVKILKNAIKAMVISLLYIKPISDLYQNIISTYLFKAAVLVQSSVTQSKIQITLKR